ncbi:hypothetical protein HpNP14_02950 [Helicobacter pylori]
MRSFGVSNMRLALSKNKIMPPIMLSKNKIMPPIMKNVEVAKTRV